MKCINKLNIVNFRGLTRVELINTKQINILVGDNNSGKTSIMEAIQLLEYPREPGNFVKVAARRDSQYLLANFEMSSYFDSFINMFNKTFPKKGIWLEALINNEEVKLEIEGYEEKILTEIHNGDQMITAQFEQGDNNGERRSFKVNLILINPV